jgi:hypothetical protein
LLKEDSFLSEAELRLPPSCRSVRQAARPTLLYSGAGSQAFGRSWIPRAADGGSAMTSSDKVCIAMFKCSNRANFANGPNNRAVGSRWFLRRYEWWMRSATSKYEKGASNPMRLFS